MGGEAASHHRDSFPRPACGLKARGGGAEVPWAMTETAPSPETHATPLEAAYDLRRRVRWVYLLSLALIGAFAVAGHCIDPPVIGIPAATSP